MIKGLSRRSRGSLSLGIDQLESRQLLSMSSAPLHGMAATHHHHVPRIHAAALIQPGHSLRNGAHMGTAGLSATLPPSFVPPSFNIVPSPNVTRSNLTAVASVNDNDIFAVGFTSPVGGTDAPLVEHFNGTSWSVVPTPSPAVTVGSQLKGVAAVASNNVWAVGLNVTINSFGESVSHPLIEHFDGTSWKIVAAQDPAAGGVFDAVTAISANNIWAVGHLGNGRNGNLIEHFDGTSWTIVATPATAGFATLNGVSATSATDVWAVGSVGRGASVQILHFNGQSWSAVSGLPSDSSLQAVVAIAPNNVWAVGADIEHFDGTTWSVVPSPGAGAFGLDGIAASSANNIYAVGGGVEHFDGTSWSVVPSPISSANSDFLSGVIVRSDGTAVAVGTAQPNGSFATNGLIIAN
jgi:hypothetical protein